MEVMEVITSDGNIHELVHHDDPDSSDTNEHSLNNSDQFISGQEYTGPLLSGIESHSSDLDDGLLGASANCLPNNNMVMNFNSDSCFQSLNESQRNHEEFVLEEARHNTNDGNLDVNQLDKEITDLNLSRNNSLPNSQSVTEVSNMIPISEYDFNDVSVSSKESSSQGYLVINESDSTVNSMNGSDSLKTCIDEDSLKIVSDCIDCSKDQLKDCSITKDNYSKSSHLESKHSSEIKERVMSYLNKQSSYESSERESGCNKMFVKDVQPSVDSCSKVIKEDIVVSKSSFCVVNDNASVPSEMDCLSSPNNNSLCNVEEISRNSLQAESLSSDVTSGVFSNECQILPSPLKNAIFCKNASLEFTTSDTPNQQVLASSSSSSQSSLVNTENMELINENIEDSKESTTDFFVTGSQKTSTNASETDVELSCPYANSSSFSLSGATSPFSQESKISFHPTKDGDECKFKPSSPQILDHSNTSFENCSQSSHDKSGSVSTNSLFSSWGKLSFQPLTTPSINSPIFCSKSSNDGKLTDGRRSDSESLTRCVPLDDSEHENETSAMFVSKDDNNSRKTKSSEALFCNNSFSTSTDTIFSENASGKSSSNFSKLHFVSPMVSTESSWSTNSLNKNPVFSVGNDYTPFTVPLFSKSSFGNVLPDGPFKKSSDNPFSRKPSESIGIFNSPQELGFKGFSSVFNPVIATSPPSKRENICERLSSISGDSTKLTPDVSKDSLQFTFKSSSKKQDLKISDTKFNFKSLGQSSDAKKFAFNPRSQSSVEIEEKCPIYDASKSTTSFLPNINASPFQFDNFKVSTTPYNATRLPCVRRVIRPIKIFKLHEKKFTKLSKEPNVPSTSAIDLPNAPFKPAYGSDTMLDKASQFAKNVIVRYQHIVFMKEHLNISPEELRLEYYNKTHVTGPFKFSASTENRECYSLKKTHNKDSQTDENLLSKKYELAEIWRVLECPVCLDVVMPPVYQCEQGHHACLTCWNKVVTCPLCKRHKSVTRNYMAEALIDQIPLPCKYHIEGCKETVRRANKVSHEETCSYRMYQCPIPLCNQAHSYQNMCVHFKKVHKSLLHHEGHSVGKGEKFCDVLYKDHLSPSLIHAFDIAKWGLFFLREVGSKHSRALFIQVMPASPEPAAYFYHLEVCDHHDCRKECYKGRVFSMGKSTQEIVNEEEYLSLSELILKTVKKTAPLKIVVTIWQLKPAFTLSTE